MKEITLINIDSIEEICGNILNYKVDNQNTMITIQTDVVQYALPYSVENERNLMTKIKNNSIDLKKIKNKLIFDRKNYRIGLGVACGYSLLIATLSFAFSTGWVLVFGIPSLGLSVNFINILGNIKKDIKMANKQLDRANQILKFKSIDMNARMMEIERKQIKEISEAELDMTSIPKIVEEFDNREKEKSHIDILKKISKEFGGKESGTSNSQEQDKVRMPNIPNT